VLSLSARFFADTTWGAQVQVQTAENPTIGPTRAIAGTLDKADSFDAQLVEATAQPTGVAALRAALGPTVPIRIAGRVTDLPATYDIHTPTGVIGAAFVDFPLLATYKVGDHTIRHGAIVQSQPTKATQPGSSGSPVISKDGSTLLGMHIAGKAERDPQKREVAISYMIPAWELVNPRNYRNAGNQETWTLVAP
jgi:hypothetical protein